MDKVIFKMGNSSWDCYYLTNIFKTQERLLMEFLCEYFDELKIVGEKSKISKELVEKIYNDRKEDIKKSIHNFKKYWKNLEKDIFSSLKRILEIEIQSDDKFICFVGISPICPRSIELMSFSIPYYITCEGMVYILTHELIHFYYFKKLKDFNKKITLKEMDMYSEEWILSEIIASVIINGKTIRKIINSYSAYSYVCCRNLGEMVSKLYREKQISNQNFIDFYLKTKKLIREFCKHKCSTKGELCYVKYLY